MDRKEIEDKVKAILRENIDSLTSKDSIELESNLMDLGMNSLILIKIIIIIETEFDFEFSDDDLMMENFATPEKLITYIINKKT